MCMYMLVFMCAYIFEGFIYVCIYLDIVFISCTSRKRRKSSKK